MQFPNSIPVLDLFIPHPEYDPKQVLRREAYFIGGKWFPIKDELRWKEIEKTGGDAGTLVRTVRVGTGFYTNYFGDTLLDQVSHICKKPLTIDDPQERLYWVNLAVNSDGKWTPATAQIRASATDDLLHDRSFYLIRFPDKGPMPGNLQASIDGGFLDAQIIALSAASITDWRVGDDGALEWARMYEMELIRSKDYGPFDTELHRWVYFAKEAVYTYTATKPTAKPGNPPTPWTEKDNATLQPIETHSIKSGGTVANQWKDAKPACPVFKVDRKMQCHMGEKILPTAWQLFNEESDASYFRFTTLTGATIITTDDPGRFQKEGLALTPFGAVLLKTGESMTRDVGAASANMFQALDNASAQRRGQMGGLIHAMARQSASQSASGQNTSRNTGASMDAQQDPLTALLVGYAEPQISIWWGMMNAIATVRQEDISDLEMSGLIEPEEEQPDDAGEETQEVDPVKEPEAAEAS